jgi:hypothetical protein
MKLSQIVDDNNNNHHPYTDQAAETHYNNDTNNITPLPFRPFPSPLEKKKKQLQITKRHHRKQQQ